jgi:hypothetical protein
LNWAKSNATGRRRQVFAPTRATSRAVPRTAHRPDAVPDAEAAYHPPVCAPWGRPCRTAVLTLSLCATCSHPLRQPTNGVAAVRAQRRPGWLLAHAATHCAMTPELTSPPRAWPHTEPPLPPPVVLTVNSTSGCLSSQTRAAPNSTRVPSSSPFRILLRPSR